ncbi:hypothetical protein [Sinisalibacter aestuarii]|uniref:Secreted protein n=1 Tax=Sinisalibacter aestuarii TaxID=2949426 RepID=A0ABQ5LUM6_9RHOB|nr:hypothetical protein [Sinisalibacter aestuarii]GKY88056.1 hypothetical protein STA1M1_19250 [Sinisalibacter aestuarii]
MLFGNRARAGLLGAFVAALSSFAGGAGADTVVSTKGEQRFTAFLTGYTYWDNTPPGSAAIARPVVHRRAGGTGTFKDPITIAVGHSIVGSRQTLDFPAGTKFYIESLRKYAIVEDVCGDGAQPQNGPCHSGKNGHPWLDLYLGGASASVQVATACANRITRLQTLVINPGPDYPVAPGEVVDSGCRVF